MVEEFCYTCNKVTKWVALKAGSKYEKCDSCGSAFPCRRYCEHLDCAQHREEHGIRMPAKPQTKIRKPKKAEAAKATAAPPKKMTLFDRLRKL